MPAFVNASNVRAYAGINAMDAQQDRWQEAQLTSNIRAASAYLQRQTGRQFELQLATTKTFTTNGEAYINIPDLRTATAVVLSSTTLTMGTDAHFIPDHQQTGVYIGIQFRPFGRRADYRSWPNWFDTNLDRRWYSGFTSDANDLSITGDWGHSPIPEEVMHATKVLAAWYTRRPDALLGGVSVTAGGTEVDLGAMPAEVVRLIEDWRLSAQVVGVG